MARKMQPSKSHNTTVTLNDIHHLTVLSQIDATLSRPASIEKRGGAHPCFQEMTEVQQVMKLVMIEAQ